jgi:hypothetical protein
MCRLSWTWNHRGSKSRLKTNVFLANKVIVKTASQSINRHDQTIAAALPGHQHWSLGKMLQDSNANVINLFSFYDLRPFLGEHEISFFLCLHVLDALNAATCMYRDIETRASSYGRERCRLPTTDGKALCLAFQPLYYLADDPRISPDRLKDEVTAFARHCLCAEHVEDTENVNEVADRLFLAVQRWQGMRVFKDEPDRLPFTPPPSEERPGASRLTLFFSKTRSRSPKRRPKFESRAIDYEAEDQSWGFQRAELPRADQPGLRRLSSSDALYQPSLTYATSVAQPGPAERLPSARQNQHHLFKRAKTIVNKIAKKAL